MSNKSSAAEFNIVFQERLAALQKEWDTGSMDQVAAVSREFSTLSNQFGQTALSEGLDRLASACTEGDQTDATNALEGFLNSAREVVLNMSKAQSDSLQNPGENPARTEPETEFKSEHAVGSASETAGSRPPVISNLPMDEPEFREIVEEFIPVLQEKFAQMETAYVESDQKELGNLAHWLKGAGGTVGFAEFYEPSLKLEQAAKSDQHDECAVWLRELHVIADHIVIPEMESL